MFLTWGLAPLVGVSDILTIENIRSTQPCATAYSTIYIYTMSHAYHTIVVLSLLWGGAIYSQLPDYEPESPSAAHQYYVNQGQLLNSVGDPVPEIQYYTERTSPAVYLAEDRVSLVYHKVDTAYWSDPLATRIDTSYRLDLRFLCNPPQAVREEGYSNCARLVPDEAGSDHLNYFLPHCGANGITQVPGYHRVIYERAFPDIDVHLYSNALGLKSYFVIQPGADPNDILLQFEGQDDLGTLMTGELEMTLAQQKWIFPQATAYQIINGNPMPLSWLPTWVETAPGQVAITTGSYDSSYPLVIRVGWPVANLTASGCSPDWSTYYGGSGSETNKDVVVDTNEDFYVLTDVLDGNFPNQGGQQTYNGNSRDMYISKFDPGANRQWAVYYGGNGHDSGSELALSDQGHVYFVGLTYSLDLPMLSSNNGIFSQVSFGGGTTDASLIAVRKSDGFRYWTTYFGGDGDELGYGISISNYADRIYISGAAKASSSTSNCNNSSSGSFPLCAGSGNRYFQNYVSGGYDAFVAEFDVPTHNLLWSTYFGGNQEEVAYDVLIKDPNELEGALFIAGYTLTELTPSNISSPITSPPGGGTFPIANPGGGAYVRALNNGGAMGFVSRFNDDFQLDWSTFFGGNGHDIISQVAVNYTNDLYITGSTASDQSTTTCAPNTGGEFPICNSNGSSFIQSNFGSNNPGNLFSENDAFVARFDQNGSLAWSTYYGGESNEDGRGNGGHDIAIDTKNRVFVCGTTRLDANSPTSTIPTQPFLNYYYQPQNASAPENISAQDAYLLAFDNQNQRLWATHFGGGKGIGNLGDETGFGIATYQDQRLYLVGSTNSLNTPYACPGQLTGYPCDPTLNGTLDGYITQFCIPSSTTDIRLESSLNSSWQVFPNPVENQIRLSAQLDQPSKLIIELYDSQGRMCKEYVEFALAGKVEYTISVSELPSGVYLILVKSNQGTFSSKFVK